MNRAEFLRTSASFACASCATLLFSSAADAAEAATPATTTPVDEALKRAEAENTFTKNWMADLFEAIDTEVDPETRLKLMRATGRGCYNRHAFKQEIAQAGKGDVEKLLAAYKKNFGIQREGDLVHIRYGGGRCYCPAARNRPTRPNDLHCECTRYTHETIFSTALGRHIKVEVVESIRRGGKRCHLIAHLT